MAERELVQMKKVVWLLLKQIGGPVVIDRAILISVPADAEIYQHREPYGDSVTLEAKQATSATPSPAPDSGADASTRDRTGTAPAT